MNPIKLELGDGCKMTLEEHKDGKQVILVLECEPNSVFAWLTAEECYELADALNQMADDLYKNISNN